MPNLKETTLSSFIFQKPPRGIKHEYKSSSSIQLVVLHQIDTIIQVTSQASCWESFPTCLPAHREESE